MHLLRTRFSKDIVCEFLPPKNTRSKKVMILVGGMPSIPKKDEVIKQFADLGYWVFFPRFRGTWESGGSFLARSPHLDLFEVITGIQKGFSDIWSQKQFKLKPSTIHMIGSSFGGTAVLLAAQDKRVDKVVALSPVIDWRVESVTEPLEWFSHYVQQAFGGAYRYKQSDWNKLGTETFYNPISAMKKIDGNKVLLIHSKDDSVVAYEPTDYFAKQTRASLVTYKTQGHLSLSAIKKGITKKQVLAFLR